MAAALAALTDQNVRPERHRLVRVFRGADGRHAEDAGTLHPVDELCRRRPAIRDRRHPVLDTGIDNAVHARLERVQVHPERRRGPVPDLLERRLALPGRHHRRGQKTHGPGGYRPDHQFGCRHHTHPMAVWMMGARHPSASVSGVRSASVTGPMPALLPCPGGLPLNTVALRLCGSSRSRTPS